MHDKQSLHDMLKECKSLNLLYVEDNPLLAKNTLGMLTPFFNSIVTTADGEAGLKSYKNSTYDIVLTDIVMPKLDGCEMSRQIRQINPNQAIVVMSAYEDSKYFMSLIDIGISNFIPKPPQMNQIIRVLTSTALGINNAKKVAALTQEIKQDLAQSKELLRNIIDTVPVRIFWKDKNLIYLGGNTLFTQDANLLNQNDLIGKSDFDLPWKNEAQNYIDDDNTVMKSGKEKLSLPRATNTGKWKGSVDIHLKSSSKTR